MDTAAPAPLIDPFARPITYLRVSVTDRCDFRCVYCMAEDMTFLPKRDLLTLEELDRLSSAFIAKVRGEDDARFGQGLGMAGAPGRPRGLMPMKEAVALAAVSASIERAVNSSSAARL